MRNNKDTLNNLIRRPIGGFAYIVAEKDDRIAGIDNKIQPENAAKSAKKYESKKPLINKK